MGTLGLLYCFNVRLKQYISASFGIFEKTRSQPHIYKDLSLQVSLKTIKSQPFFNASSSISRDLPTDPGCIALNDACDEQEEKDNCCDGLICWQEKPGKWPKC